MYFKREFYIVIVNRAAILLQRIEGNSKNKQNKNQVISVVLDNTEFYVHCVVRGTDSGGDDGTG